MSNERLLQQERSIRIMGAILMLSPIGSLLFTWWSLNIINKWSFIILGQLISATSLTQWSLKIACSIVGAWMLASAKRTSWLLALIVLGLFILYGVATFKSQLSLGWFAPTVSLFVNIGFFAFIYLVEFRHDPVRISVSTHTGPRVLPQVHNHTQMHMPAQPQQQRSLSFEGVVIDFEGYGPWAKIKKMTDKELHLESFSGEPLHIQTRIVEIPIDGLHALRLHFMYRTESVYVFQIEGMKTLKTAS